MTQEQKDLLLKCLYARLPYGVKCEVIKRRIDGEIVYIRTGSDALELTVNNIKEIVTNSMYEIKPYLFPLSSMTEEQSNIYGDFCYSVIHSLAWDMQAELNELIDWLNKNMFDWRGLIPKGLAKDATGLNIY